MKTQLRALISQMIDAVGLPITLMAGLWLRAVRWQFHSLPLSRKTLRYLKLLPVRHHYYEPMVLESDLRTPLRSDRNLPGLDLNINGQLELLKKFDYQDQLLALPMRDPENGGYHYDNGLFESGDSEFLFNVVRHFKPAIVIEIGSGQSSRMMRYAIANNQSEDSAYTCRHVCIDPYAKSWLEEAGVEVIRKKVETLTPDAFQELEENDILFIDSSHMIRPQGDVLFEYLQVLGTLRSGVLVHAHDIFTPRDYLDRWVLEDGKLWNEQYLLEAFLSYNKEFSVIGSVNHLWHNHRKELSDACPVVGSQPDREPGSFWFVRN